METTDLNYRILTAECLMAIFRANDIAVGNGANELGPRHLFAAMLELYEAQYTADWMFLSAITLGRIRMKTLNDVNLRCTQTTRQLKLSGESRKMLASAISGLKDAGSCTSLHVLMAIIEHEWIIGLVFTHETGLGAESLREYLDAEVT